MPYEYEIFIQISFSITICKDYSISSVDAIPFYMVLNYLKYALGQELCESSVSLARKVIAEAV